MELPNEIVLRPRFTLELQEEPEKVLSDFESAGKNNKHFVTSRVDHHVFIRIPKKKQHFWSPQLHLEIHKIEDQPTLLKGLYGPNPTVWTLFMFLHFVVATLFIGAGIWLYTNISLNAPTTIPIVALIAFIILWFGLYFSGRIGKKVGKNEMIALRSFMYETLHQSKSIS